MLACGILTGWPSNHPSIMFAYFLTYATNAGGSALMAWRAQLLRAGPKARAIVIGLGMLRFRWGRGGRWMRCTTRLGVRSRWVLMLEVLGWCWRCGSGSWRGGLTLRGGGMVGLRGRVRRAHRGMHVMEVGAGDAKGDVGHANGRGQSSRKIL